MDESNSLKWGMNDIASFFTTKLGYKVMFLEGLVGGNQERRWWWDHIWNIKGPLKTKIHIWLALNNQLLT
jgi:hypothetical protein